MEKFTKDCLSTRSPKQTMLQHLPLDNNNKISAESLCHMIKLDAKLLGVEDIEYFQKNGWWYLFANNDWFFQSSHKIKGAKELLTQLQHFPERGRNACRLECYIWALSKSVYTLLDDKITLIKGEKTELNFIQKNVSPISYKRLIVFKHFDLEIK